MAKASDNLFPYVHLVPAAAPASPAAGSQRLYLDSGNGNRLTRKDSAGTVSVVEGGSGATGLLASMEYNPATAAVPAIPTTDSDIDATNLKVTFTAPSSGTVIVPVGIIAIGPSTGATINLTLRNGTTQVAIRRVLNLASGGTSTQVWVTPRFRVGGLTAGTSYTFKLGGFAAATGSNWGYGGTSGTIIGGATMEVWAA